MRVPEGYCTGFFRMLCGAVVFCAIAGCWEEVHYTGPDPGIRSPRSADTEGGSGSAAEPASNPPMDTADEAESFADEVASKLESDDSSADDRYAGTTPPSLPEQPVDTPPNGPPAGAETDDLFGDLETPDAPTIEAAEAAASPTVPTEPAAADPRHNTRRLAWLFGSKLSLAALANDHGAPAAEVDKWFEQSRALAQMLGTTAAALPPRSESTGSDDTASPALDYLFGEGRAIGRSLAEQHGNEHAALFELAVKSNVLLALYRPDAPVVGALAGSIRQAGQRAGVPAPLWQPLLDQLDRGAPAKEVHDAVFKLHADVDRYLSTAAP